MTFSMAFTIEILLPLKRTAPKWSLSALLKYFRGPAFEPLQAVQGCHAGSKLLLYYYLLNVTTTFQNKSQKLLLILLLFKMNPKTTTYTTTFQNESENYFWICENKNPDYISPLEM